MLPEILPVRYIHKEHSPVRKNVPDALQKKKIIVFTVEISERISEQIHAIERIAARPDLSRITFPERDVEPLLFCAASRETDEISRPVDSCYVAKASSCKLETVPSLAAAEIKNVIIPLQSCEFEERIYFIDRVVVIFHDITVRFKVKRVEKAKPPVGRQVSFEIRNRSKCFQRLRLGSFVLLICIFHNQMTDSLAFQSEAA